MTTTDAYNKGYRGEPWPGDWIGTDGDKLHRAYMSGVRAAARDSKMREILRTDPARLVLASA